MNPSHVLPCIMAAVVAISPAVAEESSPSRTQQSLPSVQNAALPPELLTAVEQLFKLGLSDPRGGDYREISLPLPRRWFGPPKSFETHGWVLPSQPGSEQRYAVCWNGQIYPVESVGAPANLDADLRNMVAALSKADSVGWRTPPPGGDAVNIEKMTFDKLPLLIRLGKIREAEESWLKRGVLLKQNFDGDNYDEEQKPPFFVLSRNWLSMKYARAIGAHAEGNPWLAADDLKELIRLRTEVEAAAPGIDLKFLDQAPALLADDLRRISEQSSRPGKIEEQEKVSEQSQRISRLIRDLENVQAWNFAVPGYLDFGMNSTVQDIAREGERAVEPLLGCLANDGRLTRSVDQGGRPRNPERGTRQRVVGVEEPALTALTQILKSRDQFPTLDVPYVNRGVQSGLDRKALAAYLRQYWERNRSKSLPQRWYDVLADDAATPTVWAEAAENLALRELEDIPLYGVFRAVKPPRQGVQDPLRGETLGNKSPSISELMIERLKESMAMKSDGFEEMQLRSSQTKLAVTLAKWDGKNQLETLRWYTEALKKIEQSEKENNGPGTISELVWFYLKRDDLGDEKALPEYAEWIRGSDQGKLSGLADMYGATFFAPLWLRPENPAIAAFTKWALADPASPWSLNPSGVGRGWIIRSAKLPLLTVPAFRALLLKQLENREIAGKVEVTKENVLVTVKYGSGEMITDPETPPEGFWQVLRVCDLLARAISGIRGAPRFEAFWSQERRDQAVRECVQFLEQYGKRLAFVPPMDDRMDYATDLTLDFAPLDHPATKEDVRAGRAIFSLEGKGETRLVKLEKSPQEASWPALKDQPEIRQAVDSESGKTTAITGYDQAGKVWQAEEVLVDGKWRPYYGFAAKNGLFAVRGEEMEFQSNGISWAKDGWGLLVETPKRKELSLGEKITVVVKIKNLHGDSRGVPSAGLEFNDAGNPGIHLSLSRRPGKIDDPIDFSLPAKNPWVSADVAPQDLKVQPLPARLAALEEADFFRFNVVIPASGPSGGVYRVTLKFSEKFSLGSAVEISSPLLEVTK